MLNTGVTSCVCYSIVLMLFLFSRDWYLSISCLIGIV